MTHELDPDPIDGRARALAQRLRDDVAQTVELDPTRVTTRPTTPRAPVVLALVAVVALVVAAITLGDDGDVEVAVDEDGTSTSVPDSSPEPTMPDMDGAPAPIALGSPDDGKDSVGLPVDADPKTGLVDGQTITVYGSEFPPNEQIGVVMCTKEAGAEFGGRGVDACNIGHFAQATSDAQGNVAVQFEVRRLAVLDGQEVDCASEPGRCIIGMGWLSDYDQSGGVAVDFDPSVPLPDPPSVEVSQTEDLADGQSVDVRVTGLVAGSDLYVMQCTGDGGRCAQIGWTNADGTGAFAGRIALWRRFGSAGYAEGGGAVNVDCAVEACTLQFQGEAPGGRAIPTPTIGFDPGRDVRQPPSVELVDQGPFAVGDTIRLRISGATPGEFADVNVCTPDQQGCVAYGGAQVDATGSVVVEVHAQAGGAAPDACAAGCPLIVSSYPTDGGRPGSFQAPPLFPDPITVSITG